MGRNTKTLLAVCLAVAFLGACTRTVYTSIRHPLHVGQVDQNSIPLQAGGAEQERALPPGTLPDYAVLTQLPADQICIQPNLWSLDQEHPARIGSADGCTAADRRCAWSGAGSRSSGPSTTRTSGRSPSTRPTSASRTAAS